MSPNSFSLPFLFSLSSVMCEEGWSGREVWGNADNLPISYRRKQRKWESEKVLFSIQRRFLPVTWKPCNPRPHSKRLSSLLLTCSSKRWLNSLQNTLMAFVWVRSTPSFDLGTKSSGVYERQSKPGQSSNFICLKNSSSRHNEYHKQLRS